MTFGLVALTLLGSGTPDAGDSAVKQREQVIAQSLRSIVPQFCSARGVPCCLTVPEGRVSADFMSLLRDPPVRRNEVDPLLGECAGSPITVKRLEWVGVKAARVEIVAGVELVGEVCKVALARRPQGWTVEKTECQWYSAM
jgi:hypothetical protein